MRFAACWDPSNCPPLGGFMVHILTSDGPLRNGFFRLLNQRLLRRCAMTRGFSGKAHRFIPAHFPRVLMKFLLRDTIVMLIRGTV